MYMDNILITFFKGVYAVTKKRSYPYVEGEVW